MTSSAPGACQPFVSQPMFGLLKYFMPPPRNTNLYVVPCRRCDRKTKHICLGDLIKSVKVGYRRRTELHVRLRCTQCRCESIQEKPS